MSPLFADFADHVADELEDRADLLVAAIDAVVEFARPLEDGVAQMRFEAVKLRALSIVLAGAVGHPHQDPDQHAEILGKVIEDLHLEVGTVEPLRELLRRARSFVNPHYFPGTAAALRDQIDEALGASPEHRTGSGSRPDATPFPDPAMPALRPAGAASHKPETYPS